MASDIPPPAALRATGVSKHFGGTVALNDVDIDVERGTVHALLGGNGSGKSTFIKILAGVFAADRGTFTVGAETWSAAEPDAHLARAAGLRFVHQDLGLIHDLSIAENVALDGGFPTTSTGRIAWTDLYEQVGRLLDRFEIAADPKQPVGSLRPAARTMVAIARALADDRPELVLVLDEPTASLPRHESEMLLEFVQRRAEGGQTVVFVSHRLQEVLSVASRFTVLRDGKVAGSLQGAPGEDELVELIAGTGVERSRSTGVADAGEVVFKMAGVTAAHVSDLNLVVNRGEIVGLAGLQGSGRSTVLELAFGVVPAEAGSMELEGLPYAPRDVRTAMARGVALVPEQRLADAAFVDMSLCDNLTAAVIPRYWRGWVRRNEQRRDSHDLIGKFGVKAPGPLAPFVTLSGGNQQKAIVARWLRREPTLILLDEPTQGVDIVARHDIYNTIREAAGRGAGVIVASSDLEELETLCDRVIVLRGGVVAGELGSWEATPDRVTALAQTDVVSGGAR